MHINFIGAIKMKINKLDKDFYMIARKTYKKVKEEGMDVDDLRLCLDSLLPEHKGSGEHTGFFEMMDEQFDQCSTLPKLWSKLARYWDYLNYTLLESLIHRLDDNKSLVQDMDHYLSCLRSFQASTRLCDFAKCAASKKPEVRENLEKFVVKLDLDWEACTLAKLDELRGDIIRKFNLPNFSMILEEVTPGSVIVTWTLPKVLALCVRSDIVDTNMSSFYKELGIKSIHIQGEECKYSALKHYAAHLKNMYSQLTIKKLALFKLAAIEKESTRRSKFDKFTKSTFRGDQDDIVYSKHHMEEDEVGCPTHWTNRKQPRLVIIEGAPGVGKTTFSRQFCYKWSQGQRLSKHKLLVLLPLRDEGVRSAKNVSDLFPHPQLQQAIAEEVEGSGGEGVALWLEGWDELKQGLRNESSIFLDLLHGHVLPKAIIIITSRPWASKNIRESASMKLVDQHIEIITTPDTELQRVLEKRIKPDNRAIFLNYLKHNLMMKAGMHTPVTANIVADVFQWCQDTDIPATMTELYTALVRMLLTEHVRSYHKAEMKHIQSLDKLPKDMKKQLLNICRLAWEGLEKQQRLTFNGIQVGGGTLGLMHEVKELYRGKDGQLSYHFIHLTLQEFLSAYHITQLPPDKQEQIIQEHIDTGYLTMTVRFFFGLTKQNTLTSSLISHHISSQCENQHMSVFYWLFESRSEIFTKSLGTDQEVEVRSSYSWTSLDYFVLGAAVSRYHFQWNLRLSLAGLGQEELSSLFNGMAVSSSCDNTAILSSQKGAIKFDLSSNHFSSSLQNLSKCPPDALHRITALKLGTNQLNRDDLYALSEAIPELTSLQSLSMPGNSIGDGGAVEILKSLRKIALEELDLRGTDVGEQDTPFLIELLSNGHLKELSIDGNLLPSIKSVIRKIPLPDSMLQLDTLDMSYSYISNETALSMVPLLMNSKLRFSKLNIGMECGISSEIAKLIASTLAQNNWLKSLKVSYNTNIGDTGAGALGQMLRSNATLEELEIEDCGITSDGALELAKALSKNSTLKILDMSMNEIGEEGAKAISRMLEVNMTLETLYLHGDRSLEQEGASELIASLAKNTTLQCLTLSRSYQQDVSDARVKWKGR